MKVQLRKPFFPPASISKINADIALVLQNGKLVLGEHLKKFESEFAQFEAGQISEEDKNWEAALKYYAQCTSINSKSLKCLLGKGHTGCRRRGRLRLNAQAAGCAGDFPQ